MYGEKLKNEINTTTAPLPIKHKQKNCLFRVTSQKMIGRLGAMFFCLFGGGGGVFIDKTANITIKTRFFFLFFPKILKKN